jgi:hypothetical protein
MKPNRVLCFLALVFSVGCANVTEPDPLLPVLLAAPTEVSIDGISFEAQAFAWRDFQPGVGRHGGPLAIVIRVAAGTPPAAITRLWAIRDSEVWSSEVSLVDGTSDWVARGGPRWEPERAIHVVVEVRHPSVGTRLLRFPNDIISRVE